MQLSEFSIRIIFLFLPGIISFIILENLTVHEELKLYDKLIGYLVLGVLSYFLYYLFAGVLNLIPLFNLKFVFLNSLFNEKAELNITEVVIATALSIPLGLFVSYAMNHTLLHRIARRLGVSKNFGDLNVWSYIMNSPIYPWIRIRDIENDLMYEGWVEVFSDSEKVDELFIRDVKVYTNKTAKPLYETPGLYLPRKRKNLVIEFPSMQYTELINRYLKKEK